MNELQYEHVRGYLEMMNHSFIVRYNLLYLYWAEFVRENWLLKESSCDDQKILFKKKERRLCVETFLDSNSLGRLVLHISPDFSISSGR